MKVTKNMTTMTRHLLCGIVLAALALGGVVNAASDLKHQMIEIFAEKGSDVTITVGSEDERETLVFSQSELSDLAAIDTKLAHLDEETRNTVMRALDSINRVNHGEFDGELHTDDEQHEVVIMHEGEGTLVKKVIELDHSSEGTPGEMKKRHIIIAGDHEVLTGHTDAIVGLIKKGRFTQEELDKLQAAIDAKR